MGADIHFYGERLSKNNTYEFIDQFFDMRSYRVFGFLADVRNYSAVTPISEKRGIPANISPEVRDGYEYWCGDGHSHSWLYLEEMLNFNYEDQMEDRRCTVNGNGSRTTPEGEGEIKSYRDFLGEFYFNELEKLKESGVDRVVFWFDN